MPTVPAKVETGDAADATTVAEFIKSSGAHVDESEIIDTLRQLMHEGWLDDSPDPLSVEEAEFLAELGNVRDNRDALTRARIGAALRVERGHTVTEIANLIGRSESRVRHMIKEGLLFAYPGAGRGTARRLPEWQLEGGIPIPGLAAVLNALPTSFTPLEIRDFAHHARVDHPTKDETIPLLAWLASGGDPAPGIALAADQAQTL